MIKFLCQLFGYGKKEMKRLLVILSTLAFLFSACNGDGNQDCSEQVSQAIQKQQKICEERIEKVHDNHEAILKEQKAKWQGKKEGLEAEIERLESATECKNNRINELLNEVKNLKAEIKKLESQAQEWKQKYEDCINQPEPDHSPEPIRSLKVRNGKWIVNGERVKFKGVSKREAWCVGSGVRTNVPYEYADYKRILFTADWTTKGGYIPYVRHIVPDNRLGWTEREIRDYLEKGFVVEVELWDVGKPNSKYQEEDWKSVVDRYLKYPVVFEANNEFIGDPDKKSWAIQKVINIVNYVKRKGGYVVAGAWSGPGGKKMAEEFKKRCDRYDMITHHRPWDESVRGDANELHTRDISLSRTKYLFKHFYSWEAQSVNVYPLYSFSDEPWKLFKDSVRFVANFN